MSLKFENPKDPNAIADYPIGWEEAEHDPISAHSVRVVTGVIPTPDPNTDLIIIAHNVIENVVVVRLGGGADGQSYRIECEVTLQSGQVFNREVKLRVKNL